MWFNQVGDKVSLEYYQVRPKYDPCNEMHTWVTNTLTEK